MGRMMLQSNNHWVSKDGLWQGHLLNAWKLVHHVESLVLLPLDTESCSLRKDALIRELLKS